jgi:hypothetical protein
MAGIEELPEEQIVEMKEQRLQLINGESDEAEGRPIDQKG